MFFLIIVDSSKLLTLTCTQAYTNVTLLACQQIPDREEYLLVLKRYPKLEFLVPQTGVYSSNQLVLLLYEQQVTPHHTKLIAKVRREPSLPCCCSVDRECHRNRTAMVKCAQRTPKYSSCLFLQAYKCDYHGAQSY